MLETLEELIAVIRQRKGSSIEESYTRKLLDNKKLSVEKVKEEIQNECKHKGETFVQFDKSNSMKKYCSECKRELGYPTKAEQETFLGKKQ